MSSPKRKILESDIDETDQKKVKESKECSENTGLSTCPAINGVNVDSTQEYELEDSDGFEFALDEVEKEVGKDEAIYGGVDFETVTKLQREGTEEYTQDIEGDTSEEKQESVCRNSLEKFESVQRDAELITGIVTGVEVENVYERILRNRKETNRVNIVTNEILEIDQNTNALEGSTVSASSSNGDIFNEVAEVLVVRPNADPSRVYDLLDHLKDSEDKVAKVLEQLTTADDILSRSGSDISTDTTDSSSTENRDKATGKDPFSDPSFRNNPLYKDVKTLRKVLPEKDPNEIYAFLEAHYDKPNRVQVVIDELTKSESQDSLPIPSAESLEDLDRGKAPLTAEDVLLADLKELKDIFRDCDPNFMYDKLNNLSDGNDRVQKIAAELFENKNYPKLKDVLEKEKKEELKYKIIGMNFNMDTFLKKFPTPVEYFNDIARTMNKNYKDHVLVYMKNTYPFLKVGYIKKTLDNQNYHLTTTVKIVDQALRFIMGGPSKKKRATPRTEQIDYPDDPDEPFFQERIYCQHIREIKGYIDEQIRSRTIKVEAARKHGELMECGCCFDDECLFEEMAGCADGHIFCKECVRRSTEAAVGEGKSKFLCLTGTCQSEFPWTVLQELLPASTFSLALRKMQEEELRLADIPDLVSCPFCSFATIMPDEEDKIFKCLNAECLKESCRLCKEPNHVPLRCNEVEKQGATSLRTYIETKVSEAMLRICPKCKKRFYKLAGCNKMTCTCGTSMCYVCREPDIDYDHFEKGECSIDSNVNELHAEEMEKAAEQAKAEYLKDHPDQNPDLDTANLLNKLKEAWGDADDYSDGDDDEEYDE